MLNQIEKDIKERGIFNVLYGCLVVVIALLPVLILCKTGLGEWIFSEEW